MNLSKAFSGQQALITGGMGFIGSNLARRLIQLGAEVTLVDSLEPDSGANVFNVIDIKKQVRFIQADIRDEQKIKQAIQRTKFLFNLAGQSSHLGSVQNPIKDLEVNGVGQLMLLELCRQYNPEIRVVYAGTRQIYGRTKYLPVDESHPILPVDYNGVSKNTAAMYHLAFNSIYGMWTSTLRMTNVYGPHMRIKDDHLTFIGWWLRQLLGGDEIKIFGDGKQIRDLNHVDDVVEALLLSVIHPQAQGKIYNLGGEPVSLIDLALLMIEINGSGNYQFVPFPENRKRIDIGDYFGDYSQIKNELGWQPRVQLREGITSTLEFYRKYKDQYL